MSSTLKDSISTITTKDLGGFYVTNLYLKLFPEDRVNKKYLIVYKDLIKVQKDFLKAKNLPKEILDSIEQDFKVIESFIEDHKNLEGAKGIAIFSCSKKGLFEAIKLPYVYKNRLMISSHPLIREIIAIDEELGTIGVLLVDKKHIKFYIIDLESIYIVKDFLEPLATRAHKFHAGGRALKGAEGIIVHGMPSRIGAPNAVEHGVGEYRFNMRIQEELHRMYKIANDALMEAFKTYKFDKLIIGSEREDIKAIENHLHPYILQRLIGYIKLNPETDLESEIREKALELVLEKEKEQEEKIVNSLLELKEQGLAVSGSSKVLEQLMLGNVKTLIINEDFTKPGFLCEKSNIPSLKPECPLDEEKPIELPDIVDEIVEFALEERASIKIITKKENQKKVDGLGALLRFKI